MVFIGGLHNARLIFLRRLILHGDDIEARGFCRFDGVIRVFKDDGILLPLAHKFHGFEVDIRELLAPSHLCAGVDLGEIIVKPGSLEGRLDEIAVRRRGRADFHAVFLEQLQKFPHMRLGLNRMEIALFQNFVDTLRHFVRAPGDAVFQPEYIRRFLKAQRL